MQGSGVVLLDRVLMSECVPFGSPFTIALSLLQLLQGVDDTGVRLESTVHLLQSFGLWRMNFLQNMVVDS